MSALRVLLLARTPWLVYPTWGVQAIEKVRACRQGSEAADFETAGNPIAKDCRLPLADGDACVFRGALYPEAHTEQVMAVFDLSGIPSQLAGEGYELKMKNQQGSA